MSDDQVYRYMEFRFDQGRLERSKNIQVITFDEGLEALPDHHYMAVGGDSQHYLHTKPHLDCDCRDFAVTRDTLCKHLIAALRFEGDDLLEHAIKVAEVPRTVTVVAGPPAAGKNTYVEKHKGEYDLVWDFDAISEALGGRFRSVMNKDFIVAMRNAFLVELKAQIEAKTLSEDVWIIWCLPNAGTRDKLARELNADVVVLETPTEQCEENEKGRGGDIEAIRTKRDADYWWKRYSKRPEDTIIKWEDQ